MLIAFEGIDGSGKSELSLEFCRYLNEEWSSEEAYSLRSPLFQEPWFKDTRRKFVWTKQPDFTSEEADRLNKMVQLSDAYKREAMFLSSHIRNRAYITEGHKVTDRYIWSALAYSKYYTPAVYPFLEEMYAKNGLFQDPDLYIVVDTPIECCATRMRIQDKDDLIALRQAYLDTEYLIKAPVIRVSSESIPELTVEESKKEALEKLIKAFNGFMETK